MVMITTIVTIMILLPSARKLLHYIVSIAFRVPCTYRCGQRYTGAFSARGPGLKPEPVPETPSIPPLTGTDHAYDSPNNHAATRRLMVAEIQLASMLSGFDTAILPCQPCSTLHHCRHDCRYHYYKSGSWRLPWATILSDSSRDIYQIFVRFLQCACCGVENIGWR